MENEAKTAMTQFALKLTGLGSLRGALQALPEAMRNRVIVPVLTSCIKEVERAIVPLIPYQKNKRRGAFHFRDVMTSVVQQYPQLGTVVALTGPESGKAPHAHLVEEGTGPRVTNSKAVYRRLGTRTKHVIKHGRLVTKVVYEKKSVGSQQRRKNQGQMNRGIMPAFHPVRLGLEKTEADVRADLEAGLRSGITRELTEAKLARGVA